MNKNPWTGRSNDPGLQPLEMATFRYLEDVKPARLPHGNLLTNPSPTWGYKLYKTDGTFLKNGITSKPFPEQRYSRSFMADKYMVPLLFQDRRAAYQWEFEQNQIKKGPLNFNNH